jgi:hypothetical protein
LIAIGIFSVLHIVDEDQVFFEREEDPKGADPQAIFSLSVRKLSDIAAKIILEKIEPMSDVAPDLRGKPAQFFEGFLPYLKSIPHWLRWV